MKPALGASGAVCAVFFLAGCAGAISPASKVSISGGEEASDSAPSAVNHSVVSLATNSEFYASTTNRASPYCSGVVLSSHLVLTAAHCVEFLDRQMTLVLFAPSATAAIRDAAHRVRQVTGFERHPGFPLVARESAGLTMQQSPYAEEPETWMKENPGVPPNDLAIVKFSGDLPEGFEPVKISAPDGATPTTVTLAGYGISRSFNISDNGVLRFVRGVKVQPIDEDSQKRLWLPTSETLDVNAISAGQHPLGACPGDSGGPAFVDSGASQELIGILSLGASEHAGPGARMVYCLGHVAGDGSDVGNIYTDIRKYHSWISEVKARMDP